MNWFIKALKQYADFKGRARRKEFWLFILFYFIFYVLAVVLDNVLGITIDYMYVGPVTSMLSLVMIIPNLSVTVRRLHDIGKSGWFIFIGLIPVIGSIWLLVLMFKNSQSGTNEYGPNPKEIVVE